MRTNYFMILIAVVIVVMFLVPTAVATANVGISANPTSIMKTGSTAITVKATNLVDAKTLPVPFGSTDDYLRTINKPLSVTFTYNVKVIEKGFLFSETYSDVTFKRVVTYYKDYYIISNKDINAKTKIELEDGTTVYPKTQDEMNSYLFNLEKNYPLTGTKIWGTQLPLKSTVSKDIYSEVTMEWPEFKKHDITPLWTPEFRAGSTPAIKSNNIKVTVSTKDQVLPEIIGAKPTNAATDIPVNTPITVIFSEAMDQSSVKSAFSISPATTGSFSWSGNTMTYTPSSSLGYGTTYTVYIKTGAKDLAGNSLKASSGWSFETTPQPGNTASPITPSLYTPADNAIITTVTPAFDWSDFNSPDGKSKQTKYRIRVWEDSGANTEGTKMVLDKEYSGSTSQVTPSRTAYINGGIVDGKNYHWHVQIMNNYGTWSDWANDALDSSNHMDFQVDTKAPSVIDSTPKTNDIPVNSQITVTFSEAMNQGSVQSAFSTSPSTSGRFSWNGNTMTFTPNSNLGYSTRYTISVGTGAKDLAGNSLQSTYRREFRTTSEPVPIPPVDSIAPTVIDSTPKTNDIPVNSQIKVIFSEAMDQSSAQSAFSTSPSTTGRFSWSGNTMTYTPSSSLGYGTTYTVNVGTGAKDLAGNSLQSTYRWQFSTESEVDGGNDHGDSGEQTVLFEDDFESYETGSYLGSPWKILFSGNYGYVTNEKAYSGTKSYKSQGRKGWSRNDIVPLDTIDKVGYEIAICPQGQDTRVCLYNRDVGSWGSHDASVSFGADGKAYAGGQLILDSYDTNQWYFVRAEVDFEKWLMDVYINGELVADDVSALTEYPTSGGARYNCLNLESLWESDPGIYYDSIKVFRLDEV